MHFSVRNVHCCLIETTYVARTTAKLKNCLSSVSNEPFMFNFKGMAFFYLHTKSAAYFERCFRWHDMCKIHHMYIINITMS